MELNGAWTDVGVLCQGRGGLLAAAATATAPPRGPVRGGGLSCINPSFVPQLASAVGISRLYRRFPRVLGKGEL